MGIEFEIEIITRMDHLNTMFQGNFYNFVAGKVSADWCVLASFTDDVGFIGLCKCVSAVILLSLTIVELDNYVLCRCMLSRSS